MNDQTNVSTNDSDNSVQQSLQLNEPQKRRVCPAVEYGSIDIAVEDLLVDGKLYLYPEVTGRGFFQVNLRGDRLVFQAGGFVGLIPINSKVAIDVHPRVPIRNLEHILQVVDQSPTSLAPHTRHYELGDDAVPSLLDFMTEALLNALNEIERHGLLRQYERREDDTSFPHGRILQGETLQRHVVHGITHRVTATWFDRTIDNAPNRCLKYAIWYLAQKYAAQKPRKGLAKLVSGLNRAYSRFQGVELDKSLAFLSDPVVVNPRSLPAIRSYYVRLLYLASTIIRDRGVRFSDKTDTSIELASFVVNLETIFEKYVRTVLYSKLPGRYPQYEVLNGNVDGQTGAEKPLFDVGHSEDTANTNIANPDIVIRDYRTLGAVPKTRIILDAKYKVIQSVPDRNDLNQVIAYALSYRAPFAVIIHPGDKGRSGLTALGRIDSLRVFLYTYNLDNEKLEDEEDRFVESIAQLLNSVISSY